MINYKKGNLLDVTHGVIAHGCNAKGVMGSGVALAVKQKYPKAYHSYKHGIDTGILELGSAQLIRLTDDLYLANCITQLDYGREPGVRYISYAALEVAFVDLRLQLMDINTHMDIHIPKIGAGLGGGDWAIISKIIENVMPNHNIYCWEL